MVREIEKIITYYPLDVHQLI